MPADLAGVRAALDATFSAKGSAPHVTASSALRLRGPFTASGLPLYLLQNVTAGVFAEDRYAVSLTAAPGARARVATTSATKVYSMPQGRAESHVSVHAHEGSCLVYAPGPTILQAGSDFHQSTRVVAAPGATVVVSDVIVFGRLARGERFAFRRFSSELEISGGTCDAPYYRQRFAVSPDEAEAATGGYGVFATLIAAGPGVASSVDRVRGGTVSADDCYAGASLLQGDTGVIVSVLAERADAAMRALRLAETAVLLSRRE